MPDIASPRSRFGFHFSLLARRWRREVVRHLAQIGLTEATWVPLIHLAELDRGVHQKELAARVGTDASSLVRVLDILEREGLIERRRDSGDGRARLVHLTETGRAEVARFSADLARIEEELLQDINDDDLRGMLAHFAAIDARLSRLAAPTDTE